MWTADDIRRLRESKSPQQMAEFIEAVKALPSPDPEFLDPKFPEQSAFILDPAKLKLVLATRRSGKSFAAGRYLFRQAYAIPRASVLYVGLTRESAKRTMCKDVLEPLNDSLGLKATYNKSDLTFTLPNKSVVYILGMDTDEKEKRKVYGQKYALVVIDEAALYSIDLRELVYSVLKPAVIDYGGTICLMGMPSNMASGLFFDLSAGQEPTQPGQWLSSDEEHGSEWSGHRWSAWQNPYIREQWLKEIAEQHRINPLIETTTVFQQEYLGRWVVDSAKLVYKYRPEFNDYDTLPSGRWHWVLGIDLGSVDPSAFSIGGYRSGDPTLYIKHTEKHPNYDVTDVAKKVRELQASHGPFDQMIIDGSAKQAVDEMRRRHHLPLVAADKRDKWDFIMVMNGDFTSKRIKLGPACTPLKEEYAKLVRDPKSAIPKEHSGKANHLCDATLYLWRHCISYLQKIPVPQPDPNTPEWFAWQEQQMMESVRNNLERAKLVSMGMSPADPFLALVRPRS